MVESKNECADAVKFLLERNWRCYLQDATGTTDKATELGSMTDVQCMFCELYNIVFIIKIQKLH